MLMHPSLLLLMVFVYFKSNSRALYVPLSSCFILGYSVHVEMALTCSVWSQNLSWYWMNHCLLRCSSVASGHLIRDAHLFSGHTHFSFQVLRGVEVHACARQKVGHSVHRPAHLFVVPVHLLWSSCTWQWAVTRLFLLLHSMAPQLVRHILRMENRFGFTAGRWGLSCVD